MCNVDRPQRGGSIFLQLLIGLRARKKLHAVVVLKGISSI